MRPAVSLGDARHRLMPASVIIDGADRVVMLNAPAAKLLQRIPDSDIELRPGGDLSAGLAALVPELRRRLRHRSDTSLALLTPDICVRACVMAAADGSHLMLVLERVERRDAVSSNLQRYALTPRECDVVVLVLYGYSNRRIAEELFLAEYTVEDHLKRVFAKLRVRTRTALAAKILGWRAGG
ncbi:MAG: response regulator transcription factor [Candidatus Eremiobacteraeota bacterium]|nr:response regulator transcription factor [Candidatus Eremiobacteraeota bacterium]MBC5828102.1 response regulator transcription factor [Candidatus Eremiobacteraeota bacterium]